MELTDEQKQRRQEKAKRRRQQASEKIENDKVLYSKLHYFFLLLRVNKISKYGLVVGSKSIDP